MTPEQAKMLSIGDTVIFAGKIRCNVSSTQGSATTFYDPNGAKFTVDHRSPFLELADVEFKAEQPQAQETSFLHWMHDPSGLLVAVGETARYRIKRTNDSGSYQGLLERHQEIVPNAVHQSLFVVMEVCERHALAEVNK